jgi:hypothetical protein
MRAVSGPARSERASRRAASRDSLAIIVRVHNRLAVTDGSEVRRAAVLD